jgi:hypothetical protein
MASLKASWSNGLARTDGRDRSVGFGGADEKTGRKKQRLSSGAQAKKLAAMKRFVLWLWQEGVIVHNPSASVQMPAWTWGFHQANKQYPFYFGILINRKSDKYDFGLYFLSTEAGHEDLANAIFQSIRFTRP